MQKEIHASCDLMLSKAERRSQENHLPERGILKFMRHYIKQAFKVIAGRWHSSSKQEENFYLAVRM